MIDNAHVLETINSYLYCYPSRTEHIEPLVELVESGADVCSRSEFRGHVTAGGIIAKSNGDILLIRHRSLDRWLLPGGHVEAGDASLLAAAVRECVEELGIHQNAVYPVQEYGAIPLDIDRHVIPENPAKGEPRHDHWDFRFVLATSADRFDLQLSEVNAVEWGDPQRHSEKLSVLLSR